MPKYQIKGPRCYDMPQYGGRTVFGDIGCEIHYHARYVRLLSASVGCNGTVNRLDPQIYHTSHCDRRLRNDSNKFHPDTEQLLNN